LQDLYAQADLPPQVAARASREVAPIYSGRRQVGQVTSSAFSPILKKYIALGTVQPPFGELGRTLKVEVTVEYERKIAPATVVETPFFNPARRRA
jgi:glycine cleavage system aminomethyltransferase T